MKRFSEFTDAQATQLAEHFNKLWKQVLTAVVLLVFGVAVGMSYGLYLVHGTSQRADSAIHAVAQLNKERSEQARKDALKAQRSAYNTCRRQQEQVPLTRKFLEITINPPLSPEQKKVVDEFYALLKAQHALTVPKCIKPPDVKGG